jgi:hypothetical protein
MSLQRIFNPWTPAFDDSHKYLALQLDRYHLPLPDSPHDRLSFIREAIKQNSFDIKLEAGSFTTPDFYPLCKEGVPLAILWLTDKPQNNFVRDGENLANHVFAQEPALGLLYNILVTSKEVLVVCFLRHIPGKPFLYVSSAQKYCTASIMLDAL